MSKSKENINKQFKEEIIRALDYHFPKSKIILFGSRARNTNKPGADVDVAVDMGHPILLRELGRARLTLENLFIPLKVDLVDMNAIPKELKETIIEEGIVWKN